MKRRTQRHAVSNGDYPEGKTKKTIEDQQQPGGSRLEAIYAAPPDSNANSVLWQEIFDAITDAICIMDRDQRIIKCNLAMRRLLNLDEEAILGRHCWELVHDSGEALENCPCRRVNASSQRESITLKHGQRWFDVTVDPQCDAQGRIKGYIHVMSDVTQAAQKEISLRETHQTLLTVLDSIDAIIYAADLQTHEIIFMNRHMRGIVKNDLTNQPCWQAFHNRKEPCEHCRDIQLLDEQGNPGDLQVWEAMNDEGTFWYLHHDRAIRWVDGRLVRLHVATDISAVKFIEQERRQTEERLRQAQKMEAIGTLAGGIAHDFNNILSAILGFSELALDDAKRGQANPTFIGQVHKAGQRARDLVQQILTFSRQTETEAKPIQVQPIIKEALKLLRASLPSTIEITAEIQSESIVKADPVQIHQVIMNLCANASHAMRQKGGQLIVTLTEKELSDGSDGFREGMLPDRYLQMAVQDTGNGIQPNDMDKIFDPYFTTKEKGEGTGMGLAVVQGIVHSCNGSVTVSSTPQQGTTFKIYLPIIDHTDSSTLAPEAMVPFGCEHILFVDDEEPLVELGREILQRLGYRISVSTSSSQALLMFEQQPDTFDLVITDMTMPVMTGDALAMKLLELRPDIPIMICTGYSEKVTQEMIDRLGIRALIKKPIIRSDLGTAIRQVLDGKRPRPTV